MAEILQPPAPTGASPEVPPPVIDYAVLRARVDAAHQWTRTVVAGRHAPAEARAAAAELTAALGEATAVVSRALAGVRTAPPRRLRMGRRTAVRTVSTATAQWSAELVRLSAIAVWLRRTTLDDLGVHIPTTVHVDNYAATGPHIAGMGFGADAVPTPGGPRIGVDLPSIIDDARQPAAQPPRAASPITAAAATAKAA